MDLIYKSTRNNQETATASEAILKGLAGEGGLFFFIFHNNLKIIIGWRLLLYLHFYLSDYSLACFSICQTAKAKKAIPIRMHIILAAL